jgi:hypothetical protein
VVVELLLVVGTTVCPVLDLYHPVGHERDP